jgi:hypothetical protein
VVPQKKKKKKCRVAGGIIDVEILLLEEHGYEKSEDESAIPDNHQPKMLKGQERARVFLA